MGFGHVDVGTLGQKRHRILERPAVFRIGQITEFDEPRSAIGSWRVPRFNQPFVIRDQAHNLGACAAGIPAQTELLEKLEEAAINATGIPIELVNARLQLDFATKLTMSNTKFMRFIFKRQAKFETFLGNIMTDIYNTEQQNDADKVTVKCVLPSPIMFNVNNLNQILELVTQQAQAMADLVYADTNDQDVEIKKNIYKKHYVQFKLGTYLKQNELDIIKTKSDMEFEQMKTPEDEN